MTKFCLTLGKIFPLKYARKAFAAGALPRTPLGELTTLYQTPSRLGRGTLPPHTLPLGPFGASILAPSAPPFVPPHHTKILLALRTPTVFF